jgi:hypothetical protein
MKGWIGLKKKGYLELRSEEKYMKIKFGFVFSGGKLDT